MYLLRKHVRDKSLDSLSHMGLGKGKFAINHGKLKEESLNPNLTHFPSFLWHV